MNNAYELFNRIKQEGYILIKKMVAENQEEHVFLDFKEKKDSSSPGISDDDKRNYAKALSGFSNLAGGVLIWGVKTSKKRQDIPDAAQEEKPILHLKKFLTDLNSLINESLIPLNTGIYNYAVPLSEGDDKGFIVTYVPESELLPHRAMLKLNQYFTRAGDSFVMMEHHLLADSFGRRQRPKLNFRIDIRGEGNCLSGSIRCSFIIGIENIGRYVANYPALRVKFNRDFVLSRDGVDGRGNWALKPLAQTSNTTSLVGYFFSGGIDEVIHPGTDIEVGVFQPKNFFIKPEDIYSTGLVKNFLEIDYEIYAQDCQPVISNLQISTEEFLNKLHTCGVLNIEELLSKMKQAR